MPNLNSGSRWATPPFPTQDWRWQRSLAIAQHGRGATCGRTRYATRKRDGEVVQRTVRYLKKVHRSATARGLREAAKAFPDVYLATKLARDPSRRPLELHARVLAGQSNRAIARVMGLPTPTVATYVALFWDVRDRLQAGTWIRWQVLGLPLEGPRLPETLMLLSAWKHGPAVIEPWLDYLDHQGQHHDLGTLIGRVRASIELFVDVQQLRFDPETNDSLSRRSHFLLGMSTKTSPAVSPGAVWARLAARKLDQIGWRDPNDGADERRDSEEADVPELELDVFGASGRVA